MQAFILDAELGRGAAGGVEQVGGGWGVGVGGWIDGGCVGGGGGKGALVKGKL